MGRRHGRALAGRALYLFAIVFYWTPPHFWALSLLMKDEYAKAGVPMLPVVRGEDETRRQILLYTVLLYAVTQLPFCAGGSSAAIYLASAVLLGARFIASRCASTAAPTAARRCGSTSSRWPTSRCCSARWWSTRGCRGWRRAEGIASPCIGLGLYTGRARTYRCACPYVPPRCRRPSRRACLPRRAPAASAHSGNRPQRPDFAYNILPPGQYGGAGLTQNSQDQLPLYDGLTPLRGNVTEADIQRLLQARRLHPDRRHDGRPAPERPDLRIVRDEFGVPHSTPRRAPTSGTASGS